MNESLLCAVVVLVAVGLVIVVMGVVLTDVLVVLVLVGIMLVVIVYLSSGWLSCSSMCWWYSYSSSCWSLSGFVLVLVAGDTRRRRGGTHTRTLAVVLVVVGVELVLELVYLLSWV
jgi:hypothetical protein